MVPPAPVFFKVCLQWILVFVSTLNQITNCFINNFLYWMSYYIIKMLLYPSCWIIEAYTSGTFSYISVHTQVYAIQTNALIIACSPFSYYLWVMCSYSIRAQLPGTTPDIALFSSVKLQSVITFISSVLIEHMLLTFQCPAIFYDINSEYVLKLIVLYWAIILTNRHVTKP